MKIRIIGLPQGEAPEEIRRAWVGLILPLASRHPVPRVVPNFGVLSRPRTTLGAFWRMLTGRDGRSLNYLVRVADAIAILDEAAPQAATWWRENAPHLFRPTMLFGFEVEVCKEIDTPAPARTQDMD